jgi:hypothetical protein
MENLLQYLSYYKDNVILAVCYIIILISIPLSFTMAKQSQIFSSRFSGLTPTPITSNEKVTGLQQIPASSPLEDLKNSVNSIPTPLPSDSSTTGSVNFGPTLKFKINLEGRADTDNASRIFIGIASGNTSTNPTYLLTFTIDIPASGIYSSLSLAGLNVGSSYTAYIKGPGQIDVAEPFTMLAGETNLNQGEVLLLPSGDLNEDNTIDSADSSVISKIYGATPTSTNWNANADFNGDDVINSSDTAYITKNLGRTGASGVWYSPPPTASSSGTPSNGGYQGGPVTLPDPKGNGHWIWVP